MDIRRQFEVNSRLGSRHLSEVVPVATMVQRVLKLDQKFCRKQRKLEVYLFVHASMSRTNYVINKKDNDGVFFF